MQADPADVVNTPRQLLELIPAYVSAIAALLAVIAVILQVHMARREARQRAALDRIQDEMLSGEWRKIRANFLTARGMLQDGTLTIEAFTTRQNKHVELVDAVRAVLNRYEAIAIGIEHGAIDEAVYKEFWRTGLINDWSNLTKLVAELRVENKNPRLFDHTENLAQKWALPD